MANRPHLRVALLAIHPEHAAAILDGRKTVEFRKRRFATGIDHVLLYATFPMQKVVGYFKISHLDQGSPESIWRRHGRRGAVTRDLFRSYYSGAATAVAIVVESAKTFEKPIPLHEITKCSKPPQSFAYLPMEATSGFADLE